MDKEKVKQNAQDIKTKADEILKETEEEELFVPQKKKSGRANGDPIVILD